MWHWAFLYTETIIEILNWLARHATLNLTTVTCLTVQVAFQALICYFIWVVSQRAARNTDWYNPLIVLEDNDIFCVKWGKIRAFRITSTFCEERQIVLANSTVSLCSTITKHACRGAPDISNLNVFVPFLSDMSKNTKLVLFTSYKFNIC